MMLGWAGSDLKKNEKGSSSILLLTIFGRKRKITQGDA
jgi:hypothetical protein